MTLAQTPLYPCRIKGRVQTYFTFRLTFTKTFTFISSIVYKAIPKIPPEIQQPREQYGQRPQQERLPAGRLQVQPPDLHQQGGRGKLLLF